MFSNPFCNFSFFIRLFLNAISFEIKNGQVFKQLSILSIWNIERMQFFKECFSQLVKMLWANVPDSLATSNQMSLQISSL